LIPNLHAVAPDSPPSAYPYSIRHLGLEKPELIPVTEVTRSGRSTMLASVINEINTKWRKHIVTIEDPIESRSRSQVSSTSQREISVYIHAFANALGSALRPGPGARAPVMIMVGEMRDTRTIDVAWKAAETGHLVVSTLHSGGTV